MKFKLDLCIAQVDALLRLYSEPDTPLRYRTLTFGTELVIDPLYHQVLVDGANVELTRTELDLPCCLARRTGQVWSRGRLYDYLWNEDLGESGKTPFSRISAISAGSWQQLEKIYSEREGCRVQVYSTAEKQTASSGRKKQAFHHRKKERFLMMKGQLDAPLSDFL